MKYFDHKTKRKVDVYQYITGKERSDIISLKFLIENFLYTNTDTDSNPSSSLYCKNCLRTTKYHSLLINKNSSFLVCSGDYIIEDAFNIKSEPFLIKKHEFESTKRFERIENE